MKNYLLLLFMLSSSIMIGQGPLLGVVHEVYVNETEATAQGATQYPEGCNTYRIYAELSSVEAVVQGVVATNEDNEISIGTMSGYVWNYLGPSTVNGGIYAMPNIQLFIDFGIESPDVFYDSYITIGSNTDNYDLESGDVIFFPGELGVDYNIDPLVFWGYEEYINELAPVWTTTTGWLLEDVNVPNAYGVGPNLRVTLAQITTNSDLQYQLNVMCLDDLPSNGGVNHFYLWNEDQVGVSGAENEYDGSEMGLIYPSVNCDLPDACNYNQFPELPIDNDICDYSCYGCTDDSYCEYASFAYIDDGSCETLIGCMDPDAINYLEEAECPDMCFYNGCINEAALNFDPGALEDDGSCLFGIGGIIFLDSNENGSQDLGEPGIENWTVQIPSLGLSTYSSDGGEFMFDDLSEGAYEVVLTLNDNWTNTSPLSATINLLEENSSYINYGVVPDNDDFSFFNAQECCIFMPWVHCDIGFYPGVWFNNAGTANLNGSISMTWDPVLEAEVMFTSVEPDIMEDGYCEWQLTNYTPGSSDIFRIHILGPGFEYMGQFFDFDISFDFVDFNGEDNFNSGILLQPEVVCAYDPNDKYAEEEGYSDEHFILPDEEMQYRVRFQNTGNFPASQVIVRDTLSPFLDFETFEPQFASHNMTTSFEQETGAIEFAFYDINLPDSTSNEEESHGFLVYDIRPLEGLDPGTVIENTAHIYFDNNPAVITNTTWHTIYECTSEFAEFDLLAPSTCLGETVTGLTDTEYIEQYLWEINGAVQIDAEEEMNYTIGYPQSYEITFTATNPLCEQSSSQTIDGYELPEAEIDFIDENFLTTNEAESYQWFLNGEPIDGATEQEYYPALNGYYSVEIWNENDCSDLSEEMLITITSVQNLKESDITSFPNPFNDKCLINLGISGEWQIDLYNHTGQRVRSVQFTDVEVFELERGDLSSGQYILLARNNSNTFRLNLQIVD